MTYHGSIGAYLAGFIGSLLCTLAAFALVEHHLLTLPLALVALVALAVLQLLIQLVFFLHLGRRARSRNVITFAFAAAIIAIVIGGSLWIMTSLNDRMMPASGDMMQYMQTQDSM